MVAPKPGGRRRLAAWLGAFVALSFVTAAKPAAHAADGKTIFLKGSGNAPPCSICHGPDGEGQPELGYPRLAGLASAYIVEQLKSFDAGSRKNPIMAPIAKALSPAGRDAVAEYLSRQAPPAAKRRKSPDPKLIAAGKAIASNGMWAKGAPGCDQCHGPAGIGVGSAFPRLAGQSADYIKNQLDAWRKGERTNDPLHLMTGVARKLDEAEIKAAASYYASIDPVHPGWASAQGGTK